MMTEDPKAKILIIDDEENIRKMLTRALEAENYQVETALNGEDGLDKLKENDFDLILLDLKLPGMDGIEVLEAMRKQDILVPVLIVTGYGSVESAVKVMKLGAIDYLQKPFKPQDIRDQVKNILKRKEISGSELEEQEEKDYDTLILRAKAAINERNFDLAETLLKQAVNLVEENAEPYNLLGVLAEMRGKSSRAMKMYRAALDIDPSYKPAQDNIERASDFSSKPEDANLGDDETSRNNN